MASEIRVTNIKANDGSASLTVANSTGNVAVGGTLTSASIQTDTINEKTSANGVSVDGLKVKDYSLMYGSNIGLTVSSDGYVTKPNTPVVRAVRNAGHISTTGVIVFDNALINQGSHYNSSTGFFTAPISANYFISFFLLAQSGDNFDLAIQKNGVTYGDSDIRNNSAVSANLTIEASSVVDLSVGDTLSVKISYNNQTIYGTGLNGLSIFLIG